MGQTALRIGLSEEEHLAFERAADERHEYADGEIFAMSGGAWEHSLIAANILGELSTALLDRPCAASGADMRIQIPASKRYTYSDVLVVTFESIGCEIEVDRACLKVFGARESA